VRERRLRRAALRKGLHLRKSRMLDPDDSEFGMWWAVASPVDHPQDWGWLGRELTPRGGIAFEEVGGVRRGVRELLTVRGARPVPPLAEQHGYRARSGRRSVGTALFLR